MTRAERRERRAQRRARYAAYIAGLSADYAASTWIHAKVQAEIAARMASFSGTDAERAAVEGSLLLKILRRERAAGLLGPLLRKQSIKAPAHWLDEIEDRAEQRGEAS